MDIRFLPFKYANAITSLEDKKIYLSTNIDSSKINDVMMDEFAHIDSRSPDHKDEWKESCLKLYGRIPEHDPMVDEIRCEIGAEECCNIGNVTGLSNMLLDYHLLQSYRKFSKRILSTEGSWMIDSNNKLHLKPVPKGSFPVVIKYLPTISNFKHPGARQLIIEAMVAQAKITLGSIRRKLGNVPGPDGGSIGLDGDALVSEGEEAWRNITSRALSMGESMGFLSK